MKGVAMKRRIALGLIAAACLSFGGCSRALVNGPLRAGVAAADAEKWDEAVQYWAKALALNPDSPAAHNNLAVAYERQGDWDGAAREYEAALRLDPENAQIRANYESFKVRLEAGRKRRP